MNSTYTNDDLIHYMYDEMEPSTASALGEELVRNPQLAEEYRKLKEIQNKLDDEHQEPNPTTVNMVMDYSASFHSAPEHHTE